MIKIRPNTHLSHQTLMSGCSCGSSCGCSSNAFEEESYLESATKNGALNDTKVAKKASGLGVIGDNGSGKILLKKPEILAPAGSLQHLYMACDYGADAVYAGIPRWSLRVRGNGFTRDDFEQGINYAHSLGKKFFAVLNVIPHVRRSGAFTPALDEVAALKPDAFIMADPGLIDQALERHPEIPVHLSVQANTVNPGTVKFWQKLGVKRCILARELSLNEIEMIRNECPDMELEVFIHGALCIAVSGRCLISGMLARRDANVGACNNSCRWNYRIKDLHLEDASTTERINPLDLRDSPALCTEIEETSRRQGEWMPMEEDEHGSYLMNSKDLCALSVVKRLMEIGIDSLKIEGRSRSPFYAGGIARAYRLAVDALAQGESIPQESWTIVNSIPARGYTTAMLKPTNKPNEMQDYETNAPSPGMWQVVGQIERQENGRIYIKVKNRFESTSKLMIYTPQGPISLDGSTMLDKKDNPTTVAPGDGYYVSLACSSTLDLRTAVLLRDDSQHDSKIFIIP